MSELHAEKRPDKHGNIVTRWVRSFRKTNTAAAIPAPSVRKAYVPKKTFSEQEIMELCTSIQSMPHYDGRGILARKAKFIASNDPELFTRIKNAARNSAAEAEYWEHAIGNGSSMLSPENAAAAEKTLQSYRSAFVIVPLVDRIAQKDPEITKLKDSLALTKTVKTMMQNMGTKKSDEFVAAVTIIAYLKNLHNDELFEWGEGPGPGMSYPDVTKDADFIAGRLSEVEALLPEFKARRAWTQESMEMLLNSPVRVLSEGEL